MPQPIDFLNFAGVNIKNRMYTTSYGMTVYEMVCNDPGVDVVF
jgi:hypothetical protein